MQQLGVEGAVQSFHFDTLVRALCSNQDMQLYVKACTAAAQQKRENASDNIQAILQTFQDPLQDSTNIIRSAGLDEMHLQTQFVDGDLDCLQHSCKLPHAKVTIKSQAVSCVSRRSEAQPQRTPCLVGMTDFVVDTEI